MASLELYGLVRKLLIGQPNGDLVKHLLSTERLEVFSKALSNHVMMFGDIQDGDMDALAQKYITDLLMEGCEQIQ
jgi:hypothetical protein